MTDTTQRIEPLTRDGQRCAFPYTDCIRSETIDAANERITVLEGALRELVAAFTAKPDTDELDHPGGLTSAQVEMAWATWDLRQQKALDAARAALAGEPNDG